MRLVTALWVSHFILGMVLASLTVARDERQDEGPSEMAAPKQAPERIEIRGIENTYRLSPRLYSGGEPHGLAALTALKNQGIKTIISVDGVTPDVETAKKLGIRYVHLPIGYDGVPHEQAVRLVKAVKTLPGPVYVHCHHGIHRGPAAVAVCGVATEGWSHKWALDWMKQAGTSPDYRGLYKSAREFVPPSAEELARVGPELPERSKVAALVEVMVQVDERWDRLKAVQKAGFKPLTDHAELDPTHETLQLLEIFREAARLPESREKGEDFLQEMSSAELHTTTLRKAMIEYVKVPSPNPLEELETAFAVVAKSCKSCHARYRDH